MEQKHRSPRERAVRKRRWRVPWRSTTRSAAAWLLPALGGLLLSLLINHRSYLSDFNLVPGDAGDTRLLVYTLEHWFNVFRGREAFFSLHLYHPDPHSLAYNDAWFLFAIPYSVARILGADYFTSYQLLLPLLTIVGYWAWVTVLRRHLGLEPAFAILGAVLLTSLNSLQVLAEYGKFAAVNLFPVFLHLLWNVVRAGPGEGSKAALSAAGLTGGLGLLFYTSYHPPWFFVFALVVFALLSFVVAAATDGPRSFVAEVLRFSAARRRALLVGIVALGISLIPFAITYGPLVREGSVRGFDLVLEFSPTLRDVVNVSALNYVWSPILRSLGFEFGSLESQMGSPLLVLLTFGFAVIALMWRIRRSGWRQAHPRERFLVLLAATAVIIVLVSVRFGDFSLWYPVYKLVPGATAVRAVGRILMIVDMIVIVIAIWALQEIWLWLRQRGNRAPGLQYASFAILAMLLIAEQVNGTPFRLDKSAQLAFMERYPAPQRDCRAFFINDAESDDLPFGYYHLDAMMISMHLGIPTVNGYTGFEPHEAFTLIPRGDEYKYRILDWLRLRNATVDICELDYRSGQYRLVDVDTEFIAAQEDFRAGLLETYSMLYAAAGRFLAAEEDLDDLSPQYLQEHGYLDASLGYETGPRYRWIQERYWIGPHTCGNKQCVGIGVLGRYADLSPIFERYGGRARLVYFPDHDRLWDAEFIGDGTLGEALFIFSPDALSN